VSKPWWQSKKVWGTLLAAAIRIFGQHWGLDAEASSGAALMLLGGVSVEGIIDAAAAFGKAWKGIP